MALVINRPARLGTTAAHETRRPRATRREDLLTTVFATWLIVGIFVDGWAHNNDKPESFFTPWHVLFYSGAAAAALWMSWMVGRRRAGGATGLSAVPVGYGLGLLGVAVFAFGGAFDMAWHQVFGVDADLEALLSPSHLVLFCGSVLVSTSPLRSSWHDPSSRAPTFRQFLPAVLSATLCTASVAFFFMDFAPSLTGAMTDLATTVILVTPTLLLARRWVLPLGTMMFLLGTVSALVASIESFDMGLVFLSAAVGGLSGDILYRRLRPTPERPERMRAVAAVTASAMWLAYFAILGLSGTVGWSIELWGGASVMAGIVGFGLALVAFPPAIPSGDDPPGRPWFPPPYR